MLTFTRRSPRDLPFTLVTPLPLSTKIEPFCVPSGMVNSELPSSVGTVTLAPSAASTKVMGISQ